MKPEIKILHILDHSLPLHSGYTFRSQNIFKEQKKRGWEPIVLTSPKHEENLGRPTKPFEEISGIKYYRTGKVTNTSKPGVGEIRLMHQLAFRMNQICREEKPDIIHAHSPVLNAFPALWVGWKLKIPVIYEIRAFWEDAAVDHGTTYEGSVRYRVTRGMETQAAKRSKHLCVICQGLKHDLVKRGIAPEKITVIYNGINPDDFKLRSPAPGLIEKWNLRGKVVIGFIGSFYRYEGLDLLVSAFRELAKNHANIALLLVGGGEVEQELKDIIQGTFSPQMADRVIMPGRIPHEQISGVYSLVDILVYPRYSMRLTDLVTPLKPLEAMAMKKAFVASDVGGHKELIRHNETGILFPAGDLSKLIESLDALIRDDSLRSKLGENGYKWVISHHTWDKTTAHYDEVYKAVLRNKP